MLNFRTRSKNAVEKHHTSIITYTDPHSVYAEQFRTIRTNIEFVQFERQLKSLLVTSSIPSEGKSTIAANLAIVMAQTQKRILLVDGDLRKPTIHRTFKTGNNVGLTSLLMDSSMAVEEAILYRKEVNLHILTSGVQPPNPSELLSSSRMNEIMVDLNQQYDLVIYDAPPLRAVADSQILASKVDGVILVLSYEYTRKEEIKQSWEILNNAKANTIGYVMDRIPRTSDRRYRTYYNSEIKPS